MRGAPQTTSERRAVARFAGANATSILAVVLLLALAPSPMAMACVRVDDAVCALAHRASGTAMRAVSPSGAHRGTPGAVAEPADAQRADEGPAGPMWSTPRASLIDLPPPTR